ncbi:MAG TPA: M56 family metallopeptidase, partial [Candidatus Acidoferrum sp.]|nr:M56 family metallopeptidase [Candidatus Acidoferrum sp.]
MTTLLAVNSALAGFALYSSLKASVLMGLVLLVQRLFARQLSARGRYLLWLTVVISLVTPIGFTAVIPQLPAWSVSPSPVTASASASASVYAPSVPGSAQDRSTAAPVRIDAALPMRENAGLDLSTVLPLVWLGGVLLCLAIVLAGHLRFARVVRAAVPATATLQALLDACRRQTGCWQRVRLFCSTAIDVPLVTGSFRPRLLLPAGMAGELDAAQLRHVFLHELMHVSNYDIAANWMLTLLQAVHWFNPLVWFGFRQLRFDRELVRDAATLQYLATAERRQYGHTLLQLSQPVNRNPRIVSVAGIVEDHTQLKRRIVMIVHGSLPTRWQSALGAILLLLFGTMAFSMPTAAGGSGMNEAKQSNPVMVDNPAPVAAVAEPATVAPMPATSASSNAVPNKKAATVVTAPARAAAQNLHSETIVIAAPEPTLALADTVASPVAAPAIDSAATKPETYRDWNAIQTLGKAIADAREPGVKAITEWNAQAVACRLPLREAVMIRSINDANCRALWNATLKHQLSAFWNQCAAFRTDYNKL